MAHQVKIHHPRKKQKDKWPVGSSFVAAGSIEPPRDVWTIVPLLKKEGREVDTDCQIVAWKVREFRDRDGSNRRPVMCWAILFRNVDVGDGTGFVNYTLTVTAVDRKLKPLQDHTVEFQAKKTNRLIPAIDFPTDGYEIDDGELDYFMPSGTTDVALTSIKLGTLGPNGDSVLGPTDWWAEFCNIRVSHAPGNYKFEISNGTPKSVNVVVKGS